MPESAQAEFVEAVVTCAVGNTYGVSHAAVPHYNALVESFSPNEIRIMLELPTRATLLSDRLKASKGCDQRFRQLVGLLDAEQRTYERQGGLSEVVAETVIQADLLTIDHRGRRARVRT